MYKSGISFVSMLVLVLFVLNVSCTHKKKNEQSGINIIYPLNGSVFPPEISSPVFRWDAGGGEQQEFDIIFIKGDSTLFSSGVSRGINFWQPDSLVWEKIKTLSGDSETTVEIRGGKKAASRIKIRIAATGVDAPIFYRGVPLPFKYARENLDEVSWHMGNTASYQGAATVLDNIPVCGNCHSVSADGQRFAMDVDARDEKGAYTITDLQEKTIISEDNMINWSDHVNGEFTYGLLSQISPDGRYVVSTLKDCEIFVDRNNMEYSQLFFPFKGILAVYDTKEKRYFELQGANDTMFVQSNPVWSPDGKYIYFARSEAVHFEESGIYRGSTATNHSAYNDFLNGFLSGEKKFKFDIYRIPFNNGKGGKAEPVEGASENGMSNYFPRFTPDGKWMIFCKAESFMLLMPDSKLHIIPAEGGQPRLMNCNLGNMNSWHSISPNGKWMVFSSKEKGAYTQLYLTHIDSNGYSSPPVHLNMLSVPGKAANIPEFINTDPERQIEIVPEFLNDELFAHRMGEINSRKGNYDKALEYFNIALKHNSKNHSAWHGKGHVLMMKKKSDEAFRCFNRAIDLSPGTSKYYVTRGNAYLTMQNHDKAMSDFNRAIDINPYSFIAYSNRGMLFREKREYEKAEKDFKKAIELNSEATLTWVNLGALKAQTGQIGEAIDLFTRAVEINTNDPQAYLARAMAYEQTGDNLKAVSDLSAAIKLDSNNPEAYYRRAKVYLEIDDLSACINDMKIAADLGHKEASGFLSERGL